MCGRCARYGNVKVYLDEFDCRTNPTVFADLFTPRYNIPQTVDVPVIRFTNGERQLSPMRWGLLPPWTKDPKRAPLLNNARAETVADKPSFRSAFKSRRCIIPADGFYEWKKAAS
jgi:putative SOS response-associated peptidase YedK